MTPTREKIEIMQAFDKGEEIEFADKSYNNYGDASTPTWDWKTYNYRVKPKPKQTVVIEQWLVTNGKRFDVAETSDIDAFLGEGFSWQKVKLLNTYDVEL